MYACMYVYMYMCKDRGAHMFVYVYVHNFTLCASESTSTPMSASTYTRTYAHTYTFVLTCKCTFILICINICACEYVYIYIPRGSKGLLWEAPGLKVLTWSKQLMQGASLHKVCSQAKVASLHIYAPRNTHIEKQQVSTITGIGSLCTTKNTHIEKNRFQQPQGSNANFFNI